MKNNYDVVLVGGGIANILCALRLANTDKSVCLIEKGSDITKRVCPKIKTGKCINCSPCKITSGFGGAGFFSDCKLTYSHEVGGNVAEYIGKDTFYNLMKEVSDTFTKFGAREEYVYEEDFANKFSYECSKYGLKLIKFPVRHLGTDGAYDVMVRIFEYLKSCPNIDILTNTNVIDINYNLKEVIIQNAVIKANYISIAVGRLGSEWLSNICKKQGVKLTSGPVDIGVRVECPRSITDIVTNNLYDFKLIYNSSTGNKCRTFCVNPGGQVVSEHWDESTGVISTVNGHSLSDNASETTNFAILVSCHFTEPFNEPIEYGKRICRLSNMLSDGKPMVQRLQDLKNYKRSTKDRMTRLVFDPTLTEAEPGDLRYVLPSNIIDSILEFTEKLDNVMPGINDGQTIFYAPECKFSSAKIELTKDLSLTDYPNIYCAGDSAGISRGIMQASIAGTYIAEQILK